MDKSSKGDEINPPVNNKPKIVTHTYVKDLTESVNRTYKELQVDDYKFGNKITNKLSKFYTNTKDKVAVTDQSNLVYEINCLQCPKTYIGETSQLLSRRVYQHRNDCEPYRDKSKGIKEAKTALAKHAKFNNHKFDFEEVKILQKEVNRGKRRYLEALYIAENLNKVVNDKVDSRNLNSFYSEVMVKL